MSFVAGTDWLLAQVRVFFAALLGGALLSCCWYLYSGLYRPRLRRRRDWLLPDLVFSLACALMLTAYWFAFTDGGLRPADFLWLAGGLGLFRLLFRARLPRLSRRRRGKPFPGAARKRKQAVAQGGREPRPDPVLRLATRCSARAQTGLDRAGRRLRQRLAKADKEADAPGSDAGDEQGK